MHTKQELESKSDFELSAMILTVKSGGSLSSKPYATTASESSARVEIDFGMTVIDFDISDWADMGPLIDDLWRELMSSEAGDYITLWENTMYDYHCGKLRAAAIVYLLGGE